MLSMFVKFNHQIWIFQEEQARKDIEKHHFYHILTSSVIYNWTDAQQHGIYFLTWTVQPNTGKTH